MIHVTQELLDDAVVMPMMMAYLQFHLEHPGVETSTPIERPGFWPWLHRLYDRLAGFDDKTLLGWVFVDTPEWAHFKAERGL